MAIDTCLISQMGLDSNQTARQASNNHGQDAFLKVMTTQQKNQDPMEPMDNGAFLGQIAQFSQVSGIQDMQASMKSLVDTLTSNQAMQATALVGKTVVAPASSVLFSGNDALQAGVELPTAADNVTVGIFDQSGQLVRKNELGRQQSG